MLKFKEFFAVYESAGYGSQSGKRTVPIDKTTFIDLYTKHCRLYNPDTMKIYRGNRLLDEDDAKYAFCDPRESSPRLSRNTYSFTMWLMENMDEWDKYPSRSQSLICSTDYYYASGYGTPFIVIPYDTAKIGVCNAMDFFNTIKTTVGLDVAGYNRLIMQFIQQSLALMSRIYDNKRIAIPTFSTGSYEASFSSSSAVNFATKEDFFELLESLDTFYRQHPELISNIKKDLNRYNYGNIDIVGMITDGLTANVPLVEILSQKLTPKLNKFKLFGMHNFKVDDIPDYTGSWGGNEVWTDGPALMVKNEEFQQIINQEIISK